MHLTSKQKLGVFAIFCSSVLVLTCFIFAIFHQTSETVYPEATYDFYVADYSSVLDDATIEYIVREANNLASKTKAQVVVATVPDTHEDSLEKYSINLANKWKIGDEKLDNGILLLFTTEDAHVRLEVGRGLEGIINDGKAGRILDRYAVEAKNAGEWNQAAYDTFNAICRQIYKAYNLEWPAYMNEMYVRKNVTFDQSKKTLQTDLVFPSKKLF